MADESIALMAHLMRRAGFGAPYAELEARQERLRATVEELPLKRSRTSTRISCCGTRPNG